MELSEKILALRKRCGLTQEQFAEQLFVTRTAVSKWETGGGVPSMESLKMIAKICGVSLDELLGAEELLEVAKEENRKNLGRHAFFFDGALNLSALLALVLPLYKTRSGERFVSVSLARFSGWLSAFYWAFPAFLALCGALQLVLFSRECENVKRAFSVSAFVLNVGAILLCILSSQPYPAVFFFVFLLIKGGIFLLRRG